jgi:bifunctional DNase/RNase
MRKIKLEILSLSYSQTHSSSFTLVLIEPKKNKKLPIIIGSAEAQSIAMQLEKMVSPRPLSHDIIKSFADKFAIQVTEIIIYNLIEGVFFSKLICNNGGQEEEIDSRTSDAVAIALRFNCPIYTYDFILSTAGILLEDDVLEDLQKENEVDDNSGIHDPQTEFSSYTSDELKHQLNKALEEEDYERATQLRDEIAKRKNT